MKVALLPIYSSCEDPSAFMKLDMVRRVGTMHPQGLLPNRPASTKRRNQRNRDNKDSCIMQTLTGANMGEVRETMVAVLRKLWFAIDEVELCLVVSKFQ